MSYKPMSPQLFKKYVEMVGWRLDKGGVDEAEQKKRLLPAVLGKWKTHLKKGIGHGLLTRN